MPTIETEHGELFYAEAGAGDTVLVCVHGAGGSHQHWGHQLKGLAAVARVIALDLPGHGRSAGVGHSAIADYSEATLALLDALGLETALLLGHSMGAAVALHTALHAPERVVGLGLLGAGAKMRVAPAFLDGLLSDPLVTIRTLHSYFYGSQADSELVAKSEAAYVQGNPRLLRGDFLACDSFDVSGRLGDITAPTLIICGDEDKLTPPKYSQFLHSGIAGSGLHLVPGAGHMVMIEQPEVVNKAITAWLGQR
jgi:pimeloyl-ACP methyl ester carboxylesterase